MSELTLLRHIEAWRFWELIGEEKKEDGHLELALASTAHAYIWPSREPTEASCDYCGDFYCHRTMRQNGISMFNCMGGLYGYKSKSFALRKDLAVSDGNAILGTVALWGRIIEHEEGYRAQYAYPLALHGGMCWSCRKLVPLDQTHLVVTDGVFLISCPKCSYHISDFFRAEGCNWRVFFNPLNLRYALSDVWMARRHLKYLKGPGWHCDLAAYYGIPVIAEERKSPVKSVRRS